MKVEYILIKKEDDFCNSVDTFRNLLKTNSKIFINNNKIKVNNIEANLEIKHEKTTNQESFFQITLEIENDKEIYNLQEIINVIEKIFNEYEGFQLYKTWDDVSRYYCEKSYPLIYEVENLLRELIYQFMHKNAGKDWINKTLTEEENRKLKERMKSKKIKEENYLYEVAFLDLCRLLFKPYTDFKKIIKVIDDNELNNQEKIDLINKNFNKSNWDRYFSEKIDFPELDETWNKLNNYRIIVAHNKLLDQQGYDAIKKLTKIIKDKLTESLNKINSINIPEEEKEIVGKMAFEYIMPNIINDPLLTTISGIKPTIDLINNQTSMVISNTNPENALLNPYTQQIHDPMSNQESFFRINKKICKICNREFQNGQEFDVINSICSSCKLIN